MKPLLIGGLAAALFIIALSCLKFIGLCFLIIVGIGVTVGLVATFVGLWQRRQEILSGGKSLAIALVKLGVAVTAVVMILQGQMLFLILCAALWSFCQWTEKVDTAMQRLERMESSSR
jgi:hypothetical protein